MGEMPWVDVSMRLLLAVLLGAIIGLDRERAQKPAGIRTHLLVCLGSAVVMIVSIDMFMAFMAPGRNIDPGRIAAQVITGIGFLGAGTIIHAEGGLVQGLTTAASVWVVAAIGLACGAGLFFLAGFSTLLIIVSLALVNRFIPRMNKRKSPKTNDNNY